jgi:sec-independent protein translocase protein TatA
MSGRLVGEERSASSMGILSEIFGVDGVIIIVAIVIVLLFGGNKLPKLARGLGSASHEFRKGVAEGDKTSDDEGSTESKS